MSTTFSTTTSLLELLKQPSKKTEYGESKMLDYDPRFEEPNDEKQINQLLKFVDEAIESASANNLLSVSLKGPADEFTRHSTKLTALVIDRLKAAGFNAWIGPANSSQTSLLYIEWTDA